MQIHELKRKTKNKKSIKVGRGGTRGKTAGRGTKGQRARSGRKLRPELRDIIKKLPKLRGRGKNSFLSIQTKPQTVNLADIEKNFAKGDKVSPATLVAKGLIPLYKGKKQAVKILASGEISKSVTVVNCTISGKAKEAIEKAGGSVK
jgi:large subunit ribosomal protein L15